MGNISHGTQPDYKDQILQIVRSGISPIALKEKLSDYHDNDMAMAMEEMSQDERKILYRIFDAETLADIISYIEDPLEFFGELGIKQRADVINEMDDDEVTDIFRELDRESRNTLLDILDSESKQKIQLLASFDEDEIGSKISTDYVVVQKGVDIATAMHELIAQAEDKDNVSTLYVVDENDVFYGIIELSDIIRARKHMNVDDIVSTSYPYVYATEMIDDCIERLKKYSEDSIPVLDNNNKLLGIITSQDIVEIVGEEMGEDYAKLGGLSEEEDLDEPIKVSIKKRLPWLVVLLVLGTVVSSVVGAFEHVMADLTILVAFQSLILDMAGNVGTQSLAVTIRVLMDENLSGKQKLGMLFKETRVGFTNGLILSILSMGIVMVYVSTKNAYSPHMALMIALCVGAALLLAMTISSFSGTIIPMFFKKIGIDPAVASGPLITTLNDLVAVVSYYGLAWLFLINILK